MKIKRISLVLCLISFIMISGVTEGITNQSIDATIKNDQERFTTCYIQISGYIHNDWPAVIKLPNMLQILWIHDQPTTIIFGVYAYILFEEDADIKVFDKKDGNLLWEHTGSIDPLITLIGFSGEYIYTDEQELLDHISIQGNTGFFSVRLKDYP